MVTTLGRSDYARPALSRKLNCRRQKPQLTLLATSGVIAVPFSGNRMYAVVETGSKQYRVTAGTKLDVERLAVAAGQTVTLERVLLVNNEGQVRVGNPTVAGASVVVDVVEHKRGEKVIIFKMKRRKGYRKTKGHRQELTVIKVKEIKV
jgi:large subunit ribosomal protein L21